MIFVHLLLAMILGKFYGNYLFLIVGSILPDLDHLYVIIKNKLWGISKIINTLKFEKDFGIRYKTPLLHSVFGLVLSSSIIYIFSIKGALFFAGVYLLHLLIDWTDVDEKYYLYPFKIKFQGFLPIWSRCEKILTVILAVVVVLVYLV